MQEFRLWTVAHGSSLLNVVTGAVGGLNSTVVSVITVQP